MTSDEIEAMLAAMDKDGDNTVSREGTLDRRVPMYRWMQFRVWYKALHLHRETPRLTMAWCAEFTGWWLDKQTGGEYIGNFNTNALKGVLPNP